MVTHSESLKVKLMDVLKVTQRVCWLVMVILMALHLVHWRTYDTPGDIASQHYPRPLGILFERLMPPNCRV